MAVHLALHAIPPYAHLVNCHSGVGGGGTLVAAPGLQPPVLNLPWLDLLLKGPRMGEVGGLRIDPTVLKGYLWDLQHSCVGSLFSLLGRYA